MSTVKVNEIRHLSNSGTANMVLESNADTNLQATTTLGLTVTGTLTVSGVATLNGNTVIGNASTDTMVLTSTVSGFNNFSGFTGEIRMYAGNAAGDSPPAGWLYCNGDTISQLTGHGGTHYNADGKGNDYQPLFNLLKASSDWGNSSGSTWGANTVKTPDFRSRAPVGIHTGAATSITAGLTSRTLSDAVGTETHALTVAELAVHTHLTTATGPSVSGQSITGTIADHTHAYAHTHTLSAHTHTFIGTEMGTHYHGAGIDVAPIYGTYRTLNVYNLYNHAQHSRSSTIESQTSSHTAGTPAGSIGVPSADITAGQNTSTTGNQSANGITASLGSETHTHTFAQANAEHSGTSAAGTAHTILQPIIAVNYIIKV